MNNSHNETKGFWRPREFSVQHRIGLNQVYEAIRRGEIPSIRIGGSLLIPKAAWEEKLASAGRVDVERGSASQALGTR